METNKRYEDQALRTVMHRQAETSQQMKLSEGFTDRLMERIETLSRNGEGEPFGMEDKKKNMPKRHHAWIYTGVAAAIALLLTFGAVLLRHGNTEKPELIAKTDTVKEKTLSPTLPHNGEGVPSSKEGKSEKENTEKADTVDAVKEMHRNWRKPPKVYMARVAPAPKEDEEKEMVMTNEPLAEPTNNEAILAESDEFIPYQNHSPLPDLEDMKCDIRNRGERLTQYVEMAISDNTY